MPFTDTPTQPYFTECPWVTRLNWILDKILVFQVAAIVVTRKRSNLGHQVMDYEPAGFDDV